MLRVPNPCVRAAFGAQFQRIAFQNPIILNFREEHTKQPVDDKENVPKQRERYVRLKQYVVGPIVQMTSEIKKKQSRTFNEMIGDFLDTGIELRAMIITLVVGLVIMLGLWPIYEQRMIKKEIQDNITTYQTNNSSKPDNTGK